ncbi:MAG: patatin-like phospholipase family protein [Candidatus Portnoybacteria bacterium]|nr:patatin-like phospholipase family protein [Candidatus Portnoybacteria bacterium]MDD4982368.1 patatin-like phospholipase family protein [Candidatus Portnoybacteria bacterium]
MARIQTNLGQKRKKIGLALGAGGARGLAHIGVILALEEAGIPIDFIAGTSMGALVGGWYAATKNIKFLRNIFLKTSTKDLFADGVETFSEKESQKINMDFSKGLFKGEQMTALLEKLMDVKTFRQCQIPFQAVATNVETGKEVDIGNGSLAQGILASVSLPVIFQPVKFEEQLLMDGGMVNPLPVDVVKNMGADFVIAVDVSSRWVNFSDDLITQQNLNRIVSHAFMALNYQLSRRAVGQADFVLKPLVANFQWIDFERAGDIIDAGRKEAESGLDEIRVKAGYLKKEPETLMERIIELIDGN